MPQASEQEDREPTPADGDLTARLVDQFFRRWIWYVIPVVLLSAVGVRAAGNVAEPYEASGTLSASANPLVETPEVRGTSIGAFEPPAAGITRLINEQLRSDAFVEIVADGAGLRAALQSGEITPDLIRRQVGASAEGENLLSVQASWSDPDRPNRLERSSVIPSVVIDRLRELESFKLTQEDAIMQATLLELGRNGGCVSCKP